MGLCLLVVIAAAGAVQAAARPLSGVTIVIDPGHGGNDAGVDPAGSGLSEKDVVLDLSLRLRRKLEAAGATVLLTRASDRFVSQQARVQWANLVLFRPDNSATNGRLASLHINSNRQSPNLQRVEVLVDPQAGGPFPLAETLAEQIRAVTDGGFGYSDPGYPPGVHPADIALVRWTYPRGQNVLSESAFLSNAVQARRLHDPAFIDALAQAHSQALQTVLGARQ